MNISLDALRATFSGRLLTDSPDMAAFLTDWRGKWTGNAIAVAQPDDAAGVAAVLRWCHDNRVPVVPRGGNTGLSGGATPDAGGASLVLSLTRLKSIRQIDAVNNTMVVEAGVTLQQVQDAAREAGRLFPLSLAAQGSCTIGGNLATNAGGVQVLRYGNARELCLGLEVATAQGALWDGLRGLRKDNTGYDLRDLYIGSEGTLGVITAAVLKLFPLPGGRAVALVAVPSPTAAVELLQVSQQQLGADLTAFELIGDTCLGLVQKHVPGARLPLAQASPWYVLMEVSDAQDEAHASAAMQGVLEIVAAFEALEGPMNLLVHDAVNANGGSISAEHGLGVLRRDEAARYKSPVERGLMLAVKQALDPHGLMNPGKLLGSAPITAITDFRP
jgi:FAD/FMN-containing dehydrogenase